MPDGLQAYGSPEGIQGMMAACLSVTVVVLAESYRRCWQLVRQLVGQLLPHVIGNRSQQLC